MMLAPGDRKQQIEHMLKSCEEEARGLTNWERGFLESLRDQFDRRSDLSDKQVDLLEKIYVEKV